MFDDIELQARTGGRYQRQLESLLEKSMRVEDRALEAIISGWNSLSWYDPLEQMYDNQANGIQSPFQLPPPPYFRQENKRGEDVPVYTSEVQLRMLRDVSRLLCASSEYAISALENRVSYIIGEGLVYRAKSKKGCNVPEAYLDRIQELMEFFREFNSLDDLERESCFRMDVDGEAFIRLFPLESGLMKVRFVEPELVTSDRAAVSNWEPAHSFGIESNPDDVEDVLGYWVVSNPLQKMVPDFVPQEEVLHLKTSNYRSAKRGRPLFYSVSRNLQRIEQLMGSLSAMAKARAKIALIRKMRGGTPAAIEKLRQAVTSTQQTLATGQTTNIEQMQDGTILTSSDNIDYEMPSQSVGASEFIEVLKAELRGVAARVVMPEWMLTSNATDMGAYTSSLVAEAPSTRMFLRLQQYFRRAYGERRLGVGKSLMWRYLEHCVETGWLDESYIHDIEIKAEAPSVVVRDKDREATVNKTYHDMGVKSVETIQAELGLEHNTEEQNFKKEREEAPIQGSAPTLPTLPTSPKATEGFTGQKTDSAGRKWTYVDGKQVPNTEDTLPASSTSGSGIVASPAPDPEGVKATAATLSQSLPETVTGNPSRWAKVQKLAATAYALGYQFAVKLGSLAPEVLDTPEDISNPYIYGVKTASGVSHDFFSNHTGLNPWIVAKIASAVAGTLATSLRNKPAKEGAVEMTIEQKADYLIEFNTQLAASMGFTLTPDREGLIQALREASKNV